MLLKQFSNNRIIVDEVSSTNTEMLEMSHNKDLATGTVLIANNQTLGRGQRGNNWLTEPEKNLTFSVYTNPKIKVEKAYYLNIIAALAVNKTLQDLKIEAKIKWPNDILVNRKKVCGILVENQINGKLINQSIIGIGFNVNQSNFDDLENATSILNEGISIDKTDVLNQIYNYLDFYYNLLLESNFDLLLKLYYNNMFWYKQIGVFQVGYETFKAIVNGINDFGLLHLIKENGEHHFFDLKEIKFCL